MLAERMTLNNIYKGVAIIFLLCVLEIGCYFGGQFYYSQKYHADEDFDPKNYNQSRFTKVEEYIQALKDEDYLKPKFVIKYVNTVQEPTNLDELIKEAREYWQEIARQQVQDSLTKATANFVAQVNTKFEDDLVSFNAEYVSPIPIHPNGFFAFNNIKIKRQNTITTGIDEITKPYDPSFWDRFNVVIYGGVGYDFIERRPSISVGFGFGIDIKKIF